MSSTCKCNKITNANVYNSQHFSATKIGTSENPVLPFLVFWKTARKTTKKTRIFCPYRAPKIPGKEGKNAQKNKEILAGKKNKEFQKNKERKDREGPLRVSRGRKPMGSYSTKGRVFLSSVHLLKPLLRADFKTF